MLVVMSDGAPTPAAATALVGREQEVGRIDRSLSDVPDGPSALTIVGEAGIGKTALWRDGLARARDRGYRVLVSRPGEEEMPLSGVGLVDLFEGGEPVDGTGEGSGPPATGREGLHRSEERRVGKEGSGRERWEQTR